MKVAILTDALVNRGGVERIILEQARLTRADIFVGRYQPENTFPEFSKLKVLPIIKNYSIGYGNFFHSLMTLYIWFKFSKLHLKYDCFIIHGAGALNAARYNHPNLWYCHSPSRYLYDFFDDEYRSKKGIFKFLFKIITDMQRQQDQNNVKNIDKLLVNSANVKKRVEKYYQRDSQVLYPFVETKKFKYLSKGNFYLSTCRLDKIKRIDLTIKAFLRLPSKQLIIASDGPERENLMKLANGSPNIKFLGYVSENDLARLYGSCIATLYLSYKEDFGMVPLESQSAGKPCIATNDGGFKETIIHKKTGYLVEDPTNVSQVIEAITWTDKNAKKMRKCCEKNASRFNLKKFDKQFLKLVRP